MLRDESHLLHLKIVLRMEDGLWVARCAELGTLAADADFETAWEDIVRVSRCHLAYGLSIGRTLADLVKPPPANLAQIIARAEVDGSLNVRFGQEVAHVTRMIAQAA